MSGQTPIVNAAQKYIFNLRLSFVRPTRFVMLDGQARDSTNRVDIQSSVVGIEITHQGIQNRGPLGIVGGLDQGTVSPNTLYAVYVIGDSTGKSPSVGLLSTDFTGPILPFGYDCFRRTGAVRTNAVPELIEFCQVGVGEEKHTTYMDPVNVLTGGTATSFTGIVLTGVVPPRPGVAITRISFTPAMPTDAAQFRGATGAASTATGGPVIFGYGSAGPQRGNALIAYEAIGSPAMEYSLDGGEVDVDIAGFIDSL